MIPQHIFDLAVRQFAQLSVAIATVGLLTRFVCRRRPELVYALWVLVLLKSLTPPIWNSPIGIFSWAASHQIVLAPTSDDHTRITAAIAPTPVHLSSPTLVAAPMSSERQTWRIALETWSVGCAGVVLVVVIRWRMLTRRIARLSVPPPPELTEALEHACQSLRIGRRPTLRVCRAAIGPAVVGTLQPILVIPESVATRNTPARLRMMLIHELVHLRRRDPLVAGVQLLSQAIWWFHPLVWWMNRQITHAREICCDSQTIVNLRCSPAWYAQTLIDILRQRRTFEPLPLAVGIRSAGLTARRLNQIMSSSPSHLRTPRRYWAVMAICALALLPGAGVSPSRAADDDGQVLASRPVQPGAAASEQRVRHFVAVVVGIDSLTFQGQRTTLDELPAMLERVPDREHTVLELAYSDGDVTIRQFNEVQFQLMELVTKLGFEYLSMTGEHPASYQGKPDRMVDVPATQPDRILPALTPAPVSQLTHQLDFHFGQVQFAPGDTINITEVRGTSDNMMVDGTYQVKGTYTLASHDHATLAVSVSAKDPKDARGYWCADQTIRITKGSGTFTLTERLACEGYPHISFYGDNGAIGGVYFGTGSWIWQ